MDQEPDNEETPIESSGDQQEKHPVSKDVKVSLTREELSNLDELGPENPAVKDWLEANGIKEGDRLIAQIEGEADRVLVTEADDFLTRDVKQSDEWNEAKVAESARNLVAIEQGMYEHSVEIAEAGKEREPAVITEEEIRKVGDESLDSAGVNEPNEAESEPTIEATNEKAVLLDNIYEGKVYDIREELSDGLVKGLNALESESQSLIVGRRMLLDGTNDSIAQLSAALNHFEDYPNGAVQTLIKQAIDGLEGVMGATGRFGEGTLAEIDRAFGVAKVVLEEQKAQAQARDEDFKAEATRQGIDPSTSRVESATSFIHKAEHELEDSDELKTDISDLDALVQDFKNKGITRHLPALNDLLRQSYSRPLDVNELYDIVRDIKKETVEGSDLDNGLQKANRSLQATIAKLHAARGSVIVR